MTEVLSNLDDCIDRTIERVGPNLVVAAPLGLGKPVQLLNALYRRVAADSSLNLRIITALSLEVPRASSELEANFSGPIMERIFGDYEALAYLQPLKTGTLPENIQVSEFYLKAGSMKNNAYAQQHYVSSNYTHAVRDLSLIHI